MSSSFSFSSEEENPFDGYKLCGFLQFILSVADSSPAIPVSGEPCSLFSDGALVGFRCDGGAVVLPILEPNSGSDPGEEDVELLSARKRGQKAVLGGCASVAHQLHSLISHKCMEIRAVVVWASKGEESVGRAVVLVDLFLPVEVWSGWQFPRSARIAASLFKHASCDWSWRSSILASIQKSSEISYTDECIWTATDCHVLGCNMHSLPQDSHYKNLFDIHEIFKNLPCIEKQKSLVCSRIKPQDSSFSPGIWDIADDVLLRILTDLCPKDLIRVASTCSHIRSLAVSIMPCMKLKLFPHQEAAVQWMLERERVVKVYTHPLFHELSTEDGFTLYINIVSGHLTTKEPLMNDFRGGMFCDEPGLGKTVTALSLILKAHGTLADPPSGVNVIWCLQNPNRKCGYYEVSADSFRIYNSSWKRLMGHCTQKDKEVIVASEFSPGSKHKQLLNLNRTLNCSMNWSMSEFDAHNCAGDRKKVENSIVYQDFVSNVESNLQKGHAYPKVRRASKKPRKESFCRSESCETWVQCDACRKWRKMSDGDILDSMTAWFCSMNSDPRHQSCAAPEESWDRDSSITYLPGFYTKGMMQQQESNVLFFTNVLKENFMLFDSETKRALIWLTNLSSREFEEMGTVGISYFDSLVYGKDPHVYYKLFHAFGLVSKAERFSTRWYYPRKLDNLAFDSAALRIALTKRLDLFRIYLSGATLIIVPGNLVDHWNYQIKKHVRPGQLRVFVWTDTNKLSGHNLAWDYDIVITTFNRLSVEWAPRKRSVLLQVHWLRVILDEGHTLGSSQSLTNKFQMAISLVATNRWILTGTPTPNTPNSQLAHLQPMLKFLHEEAYGQDHDSWEIGIIKPFEAQLLEGKTRLCLLLQRIMISARKADLKNIPPCTKKVIYLDFTEEHAKSYNELVVTVRRNILMADWNDPSHVESLLNPKQWKLRGNTIKNVRLSCCVAGHIKVAHAGQDIQETMDILVQDGLDPFSDEYINIKIALLDGCCCSRCKDWCRLPVITPCRHLLCLDCVALNSENCTFPGCDYHYEMQSPEILKRRENPNPKWPVPKDLIELQPSYEQGDWDPDWHATSSSKVAYLVERLKKLQQVDMQNDNFLDGFHDIERHSLSIKNHSGLWTAEDTSLGGTLPEKVIIFSQFLEHINVIEKQLKIAGIKVVGMYSPMHSSNKMKSLSTFQHDWSCTALLMDGSTALGLDLSFVTHVFLMEPIWDRSMEEQVISRAHRMGATRPIYVETLVMRGTIEEQMLDFLQDTSSSRRVLKEGLKQSGKETPRAHRTLHDFAESNYLARLGFVRTAATS